VANASLTANRLEVFALEASGQPDLLVAALSVPEPGTFALAGAVQAGRRRSRSAPSANSYGVSSSFKQSLCV
jgi:hypothetical protein